MRTLVLHSSILIMLFYGPLASSAQGLERELQFTKTVEVSYYANDSNVFSSLRGIEQVDYRYGLHVEQRKESLYSDGEVRSDIRYTYPIGVLDTSAFYAEHVQVASDSVRFYDPDGTLVYGIPNLIASKDTSSWDSLMRQYITRSYFKPLHDTHTKQLKQDGFEIVQNDDSVVHYADDSTTHYTHLEWGITSYAYHPNGVTIYEEMTWYDTLADDVLYPLAHLEREVEYLNPDTCVERVTLETYSQFILIDYDLDSTIMPVLARSNEHKYDELPYAFQVSRSSAVQVFNAPPAIIMQGHYVLCDTYGRIVTDKIPFDPSTGRFQLPDGLRYGIYLLRPRTNDLPTFKFLYYNR